MNVPRIILEGALATAAIAALATLIGWTYHRIIDKDGMATYDLREHLREGVAGLLMLTIALGFLFCVGMAVSNIGES